MSPYHNNPVLQCLLEKMSLCYNNPEKSSTNKKNKYKSSGYLFFVKCSFDSTENVLDY